jgi:predicted flap endonuclease-1-like 5' DNA nuclease
MGLISKLKSLLGFGDDRPARRGNVDVTVEHEPGGAADAETERAVKEAVSEPDDEPTGAAAEPDRAEPDESAEPVEEAETGEAESETEEAEAEAAEAEAAEQTGPAAESVDSIKGIGPSYADELSRAGVETVGDLAAADADALGDETDLSPKRIAGWIEQAEARTQ